MHTARTTDGGFSYRDYRGWNDGERWELIAGQAWCMTPAPSAEHQGISGNLYYLIRQHIDAGPCRVFAAPFDVRFPDADLDGDDAIHTVLQPDITVICNSSRIDKHGGIGAPDFVAEILSPYTADRDMRDKFFIYERYGVREYWIIDPANRAIHQHVLTDTGTFAPAKLHFPETIITAQALPGLSINVADLFAW